MNVEPQTHGLPHWHFPSPSSTPRSEASHQPAFQTPKCEPSTHFLDAYYTPQITGHQTPADTPTYHSFTVVRRPAPESHSPLSPDDPKFHVNHYKGQNLPLPPVEPSRRLNSSPDPITSSNNLQRSLSAPKLRTEVSMDSFQIQTPPPTRDSSSRREYENPQQGVPTTPAGAFQGQGANPVRLEPSSMQTPQYHTPFQYPQPQFSPEMFQFPGGGPASAPAVPQARFPWDQSPQIGSYGNNPMMDAQQNPFGPSTHFSPAFSDWQAQNPPPLHPQGVFQQQQQQQNSVPQMQPNQNQVSDFWSSGGISPQMTSFSQENSFVSTTTGVNPSMIFSFSNPPQTIDPSSVRPQLTQKPVDAAGRQPYEHQMRESSREKELAKKGKQPHSRTSTASSSVSFQNNIQPGLQRSNTDSGFRRNKPRSVDSQKSSQAAENIVRRPSPLKRHSQISLTSIPEAVRPRPRTRLVVDASGRARTETVPADEEPRPDSRKSFGLWDEDDDDTDEDVLVRSQRNSFAFPSDQLRRRPSKHARMDSDPDRFDVSKRPVSSASISSLASRLETTPIGKRLSSDTNYRRFSSGSFAGSLSGDNISPAKESAVEEDATDAQAALKKLMEGRARRQEQNDPQAVLNAHNQRWSQASFDIAKFSTIQEQARSYDPFAATQLNTSLSPTSGTDPDIPTPSTERSSRSNEGTRCVCNTNEGDGQLMIQCESCTKWLHVRCIALNPQQLPPVYVCVFCTGTTPVARGGRIREPVRRVESHNSPLGYKSGSGPFRR